MIHVTSLARLHDTVRESGARTLVTLLSEGTAFVPPPGFDDDRRLHLSFHDIPEPGEGMTAPSREHLAAILDFAARWDRAHPMVVHCFAGISRSTAAAYAIACALRPDRAEDVLAAELRRLSPSATPNPLMIAHADAILGRDGRMAAAIRAIGRGADAFEGTPFFLALD